MRRRGPQAPKEGRSGETRRDGSGASWRGQSTRRGQGGSGELEPAGLEPEELERLADALLRASGPDEQYPHRASLEHQTITHHSLDDPHDPAGIEAQAQAGTTGRPSCESIPALHALIARLIVDANLTPKQRSVARPRLLGATLAEIAEKLQIPLTTARSRWRCARRRLLTVLDDRGGLQQREAARHTPSRADVERIFAAEQRRCIYHPPRHCPDGKERCRRTGVCPWVRE